MSSSPLSSPTKQQTLKLLFFILLTILLPRAMSLTTTTYKAPPTILQKLRLKMGAGKALREAVVWRYFDGVNKKDPHQIISCFAPQARLRDVCGVSDSVRDVNPEDLAERCMDFLGAHPDTTVGFHHGPICGRGNSKWVLAHWYETGTWSGSSCGIEPEGTPLTVEGQTRFLVSDDLVITDMVVTRTFSDWEKKLLGMTL